ncbi:MAG: nucleotidyltransferase domain-containing protein [Candidatus Nanoarchaeia archaeon]
MQKNYYETQKISAEPPVNKEILTKILAPQQIDEAKIKEIIEKTKERAEKFKEEAIKQFKQEIKGIALLPPKEGSIKDILVLLNIQSKDFETKLKRKEEIEEKLKKIGEKYISDIKISTIILDEIWDMCFTGKYEILSLLAISIPIYDAGWLGALRLAEIHKSMVLKELEKYVVCYVLGGSLVKGRATEASDIDTFVVIDDTDVKKMTAPELKARLRNMIWGLSEKAAMTAGVKNKLNTQVYILTEMWDCIRSANAVIFTFLRDGVPLFDRGMFQPWKLLLKQGKITPTPEAVLMYIKSGKQLLERTKLKLKEIASEDFFWSCLTPSQGILMMIGVPPPDPKETPQKLREHFVKPGLLEEKWVNILESILELRKNIEHGIVKEVSAKQVEETFTNAEKYLERLDKLAKDLEIKQVRSKINVLYEKILEDINAALNFVGVKINKNNPFELFEKELINKNLAPSRFKETIERIKALKENPQAELSEVDSLFWEEDNLAKATFELIRTQQRAKFEKFKISATYSEGKKKADIWLLSDVAFVIKDVANPKTPIYKFKIGPNSELIEQKQTDLKEINASLEKFAGTPTKISRQTIDSLKKILAEDLQIVIGT